jgi:hypothetical protein
VNEYVVASELNVFDRDLLSCVFHDKFCELLGGGRNKLLIQRRVW